MAVGVSDDQRNRALMSGGVTYPIKVLHVVRNLEYLGGTEQFLLAYLRYAHERGVVKPTVLCLEHTEERRVSLDPVTVIWSPSKVALRRSSLRLLRRAIEDLGPDIVHSHLYSPDIVATLTARRMGLPLVQSKYSMFARGRETGSNWERWVTKPIFDKVVEPLVSRSADHVVCVAEAVADLYRSYVRKRGAISVIPCTPILERDVGLAAPTPLDDVRVPAGDPLIGTIARLVPEKGLDIYVRMVPHVLEELPSARFVVVGGGPMYGDLAELALKLGVSDSISFLGPVPEARRILPSFDLFALTSQTEGIGIVVLEALAAGLPVVASDVGGLRESIGPAGGSTVADRSPEAFAKAIIRLYQDGKSMRALRTNGPRVIRENYTLERAHDRITDVYGRLLSRQASALSDRRQER